MPGPHRRPRRGQRKRTDPDRLRRLGGWQTFGKGEHLRTGEEGEKLGIALAERLLKAGAHEILSEVYQREVTREKEIPFKTNGYGKDIYAKGKVYLIGAGPGDPGLITVKGRECIARADVIIYDHLANEALLSLASADAELIYAGKVGGAHNREQGQINELLVEKALAGKVVARLKGGDPFIFGRGGEECEALADAGIPFEVVPGVTAGIGAPAYAGIPLTHRDVTTSVAFVTGHEHPGKETSEIDWERLSLGSGTIVFYMGMKNLPQIADNLVAHGRSPETPVALIRWGTRPEQEILIGTLADIAEKAGKAGFKAPAITRGGRGGKAQGEAPLVRQTAALRTGGTGHQGR